MKIRLFFIIPILIFLVSCGYQPIFQTNDVNFAIVNLEVKGLNNFNSKIKNNLNKYTNKKGKSIFYEIKINSEKRKIIVSKDSKGNTKIFNLKILVDFKVFENNQLKNEKKFIENFQYDNTTKKFELSQYEKNIEENLINKILEKINLFLYTI